MIVQNAGQRQNVRKRKQRGTGLIEVIFALFVLVMMILMFAAVIPSVARSSRYSSSYVMAAQLAQHKIDQIRKVGFSKTNADGLLEANLIDSATPTASNGTAVSFSFTNQDRLLSFFPQGAEGVVTVDNYAPSFNGSSFTMRHVEVRITWRDAAGPTSSYSTSALVASGGD